MKTKNEKTNNAKIKICVICEKEFTPGKFHPKQQCCSLDCRIIRKRKKNREEQPKKYPNGWDTIKKCIICKGQIHFNRSKQINTQLSRTYCSTECNLVTAKLYARNYRKENSEKVKKSKDKYRGKK